jgi:transcription elongation GreA/GreB family factor
MTGIIENMKKDKTSLKEKILQELKASADRDYQKAKEALESSQTYANDEELHSEGKYDTRSIEAGQLANGQRKRVHELEQTVALLDEIDITHTPSEVSVGSLLEIETEKLKRLYFISSTVGGTVLNIENDPILIISAFSPLASGAIGLQTGESFEVETPSKLRTYEIVSIWESLPNKC